jgi:hypothetical protein
MADGGRRGSTALWVLGAVGVLAVVGLALAVWLRANPPGGSTANGTVVTYQGRTYWVSGERVADSALGADVASDVPFQDTTADLRQVDGFAPDEALAAYLPALTSSQTGPGWTFVAVDQTLGTNPGADPSASAVLAR